MLQNDLNKQRKIFDLVELGTQAEKVTLLIEWNSGAIRQPNTPDRTR